MSTTYPRTTIPLSPDLRQEAERRMERDGVRSLGALVDAALRAYLAAPAGTSVGSEGRPDARLTAAVEAQTGELRRMMPVFVAMALGYRELQDQIEDVTVAIGRRHGAAAAEAEARSRTRG